MMIRLMLLMLALSLISYPIWAASPSDFHLLGIKMLNNDKKGIQKSLFELDGVSQPNSTLYRKKFNRFYPKNILRETYSIDFRFDADEKFASLAIRYRPYHDEYASSNTGIDMQHILQQLTPIIGSPMSRIRHPSAGLPSYNGYRWQDDDVSIALDREDHHPHRPIVLTVRANKSTLAQNYIAQR